MKIWFVSRHEGAITWIKNQGVAVDYWVKHLDVSQVNANDTVIGTLPITLAAEVCKKGAKFYFLVMPQQLEQRGKEHSYQDMLNAGCSIQQYDIRLIK